MDFESVEKHPPHKEGARFHVLSWSGKIGADGKIHGFTHCSEPNCEINVATKKLMRELGCLRGRSSMNGL
jgi:hypothetical protein